jgi:hypothetical protein
MYFMILQKFHYAYHVGRIIAILSMTSREIE